MANNPSSQQPNLRLQWSVFALMSFWLLIAIAAPIVAFCLTQNPLSFSLFSAIAPPAYFLYPIIRNAFPKDDRDYELAESKLKYKAQIAEAKAKYTANTLHNTKRVSS